MNVCHMLGIGEARRHVPQVKIIICTGGRRWGEKKQREIWTNDGRVVFTLAVKLRSQHQGAAADSFEHKFCY